MDLGRGAVETRPELRPLPFDCAELLSDLLLGADGVRRQIDQVGLLGVQPSQLSRQLFAEEAAGGLLVLQRLVQNPPEGADEFRLEPDRLVEVDDRFLHAFHVEVRLVALPTLPASAEVVVVDTAAALGSLQDHPALPARTVAGATPQRTLQVVMVLALSLASNLAGFEDLLNLVEQFVADERFVTPVVFLAPVDDRADVVRVAQQHGHLAIGDSRGWVLAGLAAQPSFVELVAESFERVVARRVELERLPHERSSLGVDRDCSDLTTIEPIDHVQVPDRCLADRPTLLGLLAHLEADVGAFLGRAELVDRRQNAVHQLADWGFVDVLGLRDEHDLVLSQLGHDESVVEAVPIHPRQLVDEHHVNVALGLDALEHGVECRANGHRSRRLARLDVLIDDLDIAELLGLALACQALCRQ